MAGSAPFRYRHDGWTPDKQAAFLRVLGQSGCVRDACRAIGLSTTSAYRVRRRIPEFARQWELALRRASVSLEAVAWQRAVDGVREPVFHNGEIIGHRIRYSDSLLRLLILRGDLQAAEKLREEREQAARHNPSLTFQGVTYATAKEALAARLMHLRAQVTGRSNG